MYPSPILSHLYCLLFPPAPACSLGTLENVRTYMEERILKVVLTKRSLE